MKTLLLTVACGLMAALQAQEPLPLDLEGPDVAWDRAGAGITGTWYVKAVVTDKSLSKEKKSTTVSSLRVVALDSGDLEGTFAFRKDGQCHEKRIVLQRMEEPGTFRVMAGKGCLLVELLPVGDHYLLSCKRTGFRLGTLLGRNPDMNPETLEAFQDILRRKGFSEENVFMPQQDERCMPESH